MATQTPNYGLTIFEPDDKPTWQGDWNENMTKIDTAIHDASEGGGSGGSVEIAQTTGNSTTAVMSQNAVTEALADKADSSDIPEVAQTTGDSTTATMSQAAITAALGGGDDVEYITANVSINNTLVTTIPVVRNGNTFTLNTCIRYTGSSTDNIVIIIPTSKTAISAPNNQNILLFSVSSLGAAPLLNNLTTTIDNEENNIQIKLTDNISSAGHICVLNTVGFSVIAE